jgi:hypothetical protein
MKNALFAIFGSVLCVGAADYKVENIRLPDGVPPEVGGIDFAPDGSLFVVLRRGDVFRAMPTADPNAFDWKLFATGFHNGCGIDALAPNRVRVTQMAEFTEAEDTDGDGSADRYRCFASGWGLSGNYHETNTLAEDGKGGYFLSIGTASHNGPTFEHTLGEYSKVGRRGRNFSSVQWRGWILHCDSSGKVTPYASGFRMHNGLHVDPSGELWSSDNQGDWKETTPVYHIQKGNFYGHPSSLVWDPEWPADKDPLLTYREDLDAYNRHRAKAAVLIPHQEMNRSGSEPITIPAEFGQFAGQMLLLDNNGTRITRVMLEKVGGEFQGSCTHFLNGGGLRSGNNRVRFSPDGKQIYVGQTVRGWGKLAEGLQRIASVGDAAPFDVQMVSIQKDGFQVELTDVAGETKVTDCEVESFTYQPRWTYGSPMEDRRKQLAKMNLAGNRITLTLAQLEAGRVYSIRLPELKSTSGESLRNRTVYYTANKLP